MNLGPDAAGAFADQLRASCVPTNGTEAWVTPSTVALSAVTERLNGSNIRVGAQNVHWAQSGAFTGETSPAFLKELGCTFALVGHSERRHGFCESCDLVARRAEGALKAGLTAVVCVGETKHDRDSSRTEAILTEQLTPVCAILEKEGFSNVVVAYEPVWAIGTGIVATVDEISIAHTFIENFIRSNGKGASPRILYGGSVTPSDFGGIIALKTRVGALVCGASLKVDQFCELVRIAGDFHPRFEPRTS